MYEQFFGLTAPPFQINPDPNFYYESTGHNSAHQYLRFGAFQGEGFIVVTGDIGTGKTTLLRTLLAELDPTKVVAANIASTQLDASELLTAVALGFSVTVESMDKARLLSALEAHLVSLAKTNRRALLIIDEAQNLSRTAIEELRMLSNFQLGSKALLQSFLVGQPELRNILRLPGMEQLRQRVIASCHLGPMGATETRGYIEHRLKHVGWKDRPAFDEAAHEAIFRWSAGVPRRINMLCNRLLLSVFLDESDRIDRPRVNQVAREIRAELSGLNEMPVAAGAGNAHGTITDPTGADPVGNLKYGGRAGTEFGFGRAPGVEPMRNPTRRAHIPSGLAQCESDGTAPIIAVACCQNDLVVLGALLQAFHKRKNLPTARLVQIIAPDALPDSALAAQDADDLGVPDQPWVIEIRAGTPSSERLTELFAAYVELFDYAHPSAVVVCGDNAASLLCAIAAGQVGVPVLRVNAGQRSPDRTVPQDTNRILIDHAANWLCTSERSTLMQLQSEGVPARRLSLTGNPLIDGLRYALPHSAAPAHTLERLGVPTAALTHPRGYALVCLEHLDEFGDLKAQTELMSNLRLVSKMIGLVWPMQPGTPTAASLLSTGGDLPTLPIAVTPPLRYTELIGLLRTATCVLTDNGPWQNQAAALNIPCLVMAPHDEHKISLHEAGSLSVRRSVRRIFRELSEILDTGGKPAPLPKLWDGHAAERIAGQLSQWLMARRYNLAMARVEDVAE